MLPNTIPRPGPERQIQKRIIQLRSFPIPYPPHRVKLLIILKIFLIKSRKPQIHIHQSSFQHVNILNLKSLHSLSKEQYLQRSIQPKCLLYSRIQIIQRIQLLILKIQNQIRSSVIMLSNWF